jgi:hypothetical protein
MTSFKKKSDSQMVALYGEVIGELHRRGIVRSGNNPIADMAETVVADYFGVEPEPPNQKSYDVKAKDGKRIQVKALRRTKPTRTGLSAFRTLEFDYVAVAIFGAGHGARRGGVDPSGCGQGAHGMVKDLEKPPALGH